MADVSPCDRFFEHKASNSPRPSTSTSWRDRFVVVAVAHRHILGKDRGWHSAPSAGRAVQIAHVDTQAFQLVSVFHLHLSDLLDMPQQLLLHVVVVVLLDASHFLGVSVVHLAHLVHVSLLDFPILIARRLYHLRYPSMQVPHL
eukprot:CAMPEP_0203864664 /NCGR_PEP_ID=MMETSP0359-20131031/14895_1 /ASSEMBLY_ACC=CAM_ASM_000338 /TAXON_ID=268821 /ORGANISM="Scrippsiella Hangoei, Strain SHTV-5" /LENGTH=143 /DNA_ID=CAMNT_0050782443 /DNA_START=230 /DNA_END=661 /DNA_ORIENTATION=-